MKYPGIIQLANDLRQSNSDDYETVLMDHLEEFIDCSNEINKWANITFSEKPDWYYPWVVYLAGFDIDTGEVIK